MGTRVEGGEELKALHIMYEYGTAGTGGAAAAATRLHERMLADGIDSRVACVWCNGAANGVRVFRTATWWLGVRILHALTGRWTHALELPGFSRAVDEFAPDEIHLHWIRRDTVSWRQLKRLMYGSTYPKLYVHLHDLWALNEARITELKPIFVAYSDYVAGIVRARGYAVERRELILDLVFQRINLADAHFGLDSSPKTILFGCKDGRSNPDKGFDDLARALELLPNELKTKAVLKVFGESASETRTGGVRTVFLGRIDNPEHLAELYVSSDCFAFPSVNETMGMTKLEALACGCPVVTFDRTACAEGVIHGVNGYVAKNVLDFARGIERCLKKVEKGASTSESQRKG